MCTLCTQWVVLSISELQNYPYIGVLPREAAAPCPGREPKDQELSFPANRAIHHAWAFLHAGGVPEGIATLTLC
jgi:hypothetical protein